MPSSRLFAAIILTIVVAFMVLASGCFGTNTATGTSSIVMSQPQVESVLASTSGNENGYYTTLDIRVKNNGAEGTILVEASVTQNGKTSQNEMPVYLQQGEEHELKLTFPLVWKGGDFSCNVKAVLPSSSSGSYSNPPSTPNPNTLFSSQPISQGPNVQTLVYTFTPAYSGYINISGSTNSSTGYILVSNTNSGASNTYNFSNGVPVNIPLNGGNMYSIYFGNHDSSGTITANLTGAYSNSPTTGQNTLFSSQAVSLSPGTQTLVYSFTPNYSGNISISGISSSSTGYIVVFNSTTGVSNTYNFGLGTVISAPLTAGNTYAIYFGNHDASGNVTSTLTATY